MNTIPNSQRANESTPMVGAFEVVDLPEFDITRMVAKIDTGAYSGAMHCEVIEEIVEDGKRRLKFTPTEDHQPHITDQYVKTHVRSSNGQRASRYLIDTEIIIQNERYPIRIGLTNRSEMKHDMLIGRRFLRENGMLVDVRINQEYDTDGMKQV